MNPLNDRSIATLANHVSGSANIKFAQTGTYPVNYNTDNPTYAGQTTTVANGAVVAGGTNGQCSNVYCHSGHRQL